MEKDDKREQLIAKMFRAAWKEKFSQLARLYDPKLVFQIWAELAKDEWFKKCDWKPKMTIEQALKRLDEHFISIESMIQKRR